MSQRASVIDGERVLKAVSAERAIHAVREAFVRHTRGEWTMPSKVYVSNPPHGDFRAMPAQGDGLAILKWVTSFPGNRDRGLPVVVGTILVSDATDGRWLALIDGTAVTALRTGASAAVAAAALARQDARSVGIVGCGLHGAWAARCLRAAGYSTGICSDRDESAARRLADELGWEPGPLPAALGCDIVVTVTPGHEPVIGAGILAPGTHVNALGADGPGKAEMEIEAVTACRVFCDEWAQASHGGELTGAVEAGALSRDDVTELGAVLTGAALGRTSHEETTLFDSTGLAIQDLAIAALLMDDLRRGALDAPEVSL